MLPLLVILLTDIWLRNQNTLYKEKYNGLIEQKDSIQLLILGNSHATYGVDPNPFFLYAYNLASPSQSIYFDKRLTLSLLDSLVNLRYVLISIDYHSLYFSSQDYRNVWSYYGNGIKYKKEKYWLAKLSPFLFGYSKSVSIAMIKKRIKNCLKYKNTSIIDHIDAEYDRINPMDKIRRGFIGAEGIDENCFNETWYKYRAEYTAKNYFSLNEKEEVMADLNDFIIKLKSHEIVPILFSTPTYSEYNSFLDEKILQQNQRDIQQLCELQNIVYLNYMNDKQFSKNDFNDPDHLNKQGAMKFSELLNQDISALPE